MKRSILVAVGALAVITVPVGLADAHNAAHFFLPDGTCHDVGSNKDAPIVGAGNPNQSPGLTTCPDSSTWSPATATSTAPATRPTTARRLLPGNCP